MAEIGKSPLPEARLQHKGTVLVVDDDPEYRTRMKALLLEDGYMPVACESAQHFLKFIQLQSWSWQPSLIITDLVMTGMGGYQLIRRINEMYPGRQIPVIVISKLCSSEDVGEADIAGAAAYFIKPVQPAKLLGHIKRILTIRDAKGKIIFVHDLGQRREGE